jgi:hypothetical protein
MAAQVVTLPGEPAHSRSEDDGLCRDLSKARGFHQVKARPPSLTISGGRLSGLGQRNFVEDFANENVSLDCCQTHRDDVCVYAYKEHGPRIAWRFGLNHDPANHGSSSASAANPFDSQQFVSV